MIEVQFHFFTSGYPILPAPFTREIILSLLCVLGSLVKDYWIVHA